MGMLFTFLKKLLELPNPMMKTNIDLLRTSTTIKLANRDTISPIGIVRDVEILCGKIKYPTDFLVLGSPQDDFVPLYLVDPS